MGLVKLILRHKDVEDVYIETPWATDLGNGQYRLENCPFYAYNIAFGDIVKASHSEEDGGLLFEKVVERSGHKLVRINFELPAIKGGIENNHLKALMLIGCTYEGANPRYICLDIPPEVDLDLIRDYLIEHNLEWEYASPSYDMLYPSER